MEIAASTGSGRCSRGMDCSTNNGGSLQAIAFSAACVSISSERSVAVTRYPRWDKRQAMVPVPQAKSKTVCTGNLLF